MIAEAGIPDGVVNIVPGFGETAGAALAAHPDVDKVAFTGSTEVGKLILQAAAGNLKKVTLELGGKSPNIVFKDADLEQAIPGAAERDLFQSRPVLCAGSRLYVEQSVFDEVSEGIAEHAQKIKVGSGLDPATEMGPLVSDEQLNRVCGYLESGVTEGARTLAGGKKVGDAGYFVEPTVLVDTKPNMKVVQEEIFGPVVVATPFKAADEILTNRRMTPFMVWQLGSGLATSARRINLPPSCGRERSGSTATTFSTQPCRLVDTNSPAGAAKWGKKRLSCIPK